MNAFSTATGRINDILCAVNTLVWDSRTMMPRGGAASRGQQIATLMGLAREAILDPALHEAAQVQLAEAADIQGRRAAEAVLAAIEHHSRVPARLLQEQAEQRALANAAWASAREASDFAIFRPYLEKVVALAREEAEALGYEGHPYEAMVRIYEPDETAASLRTTFDQLRDGIVPLLRQARSGPRPRTDFLYRDFAPEAQKAFCERIAISLGYDLNRGRLDTTVHPFEISFTRNDVRITSRWSRNYLPMAIFGSIHETGHALYEQGCAPELVRGVHATDLIGLYAVAGTSFGMHESQSRLYENHIGRTAPFWHTHFGALRDCFPDQLADVTVEEFVAAINRVEPGFIRIEADELSYDLHIMLRVELEMALMNGDLSVRDIPAAWNETMRRDLDLAVPDDARGCLQDVHWSTGYIGSFPTYTLGNMAAAQIVSALEASDPDVIDEAKRGRVARMNAALSDRIWKHGRSRTRNDMLASFGKDPKDPADYLAYLQKKFRTG